jgi:hypothetical protein
VAEIQAENPEVQVEEVVAIAADRAEAMLDTDAAVKEPNGAQRRWVNEPRPAWSATSSGRVVTHRRESYRVGFGWRPEPAVKVKTA